MQGQQPLLSIVAASSNDISQLAGLIRAGFADVARRFGLTPANCPKHPSNCTSAWVARDLERGVAYWMLVLNEVPIGCVGVEQASSTVCYMERLVVRPDQRGQGYGARLAQHALQAAAGQGARRVEIGIIAADSQLARFYRQLGFVKGQTRTFAHLPFEVAFMHHELKTQGPTAP